MRKLGFLIVVILVAAGFAAAQVTSPTQDVLRAHNVYGRGCIACHAPHSSAAANGGSSSANTGNLALWGENLSPLYGQTLVFGNSGRGTYSVTIPNYGTTAVTVGTNTYQPTDLSSGVSAGGRDLRHRRLPELPRRQYRDKRHDERHNL